MSLLFMRLKGIIEILHLSSKSNAQSLSEFLLSIFQSFPCAATFDEPTTNGVNRCERIAVLGETATQFLKFVPDFAGSERMRGSVDNPENIVCEAGIKPFLKLGARIIHEIFVFPLVLADECRKGIHCFSERQNALLNTLFLHQGL